MTGTDRRLAIYTAQRPRGVTSLPRVARTHRHSPAAGVVCTVHIGIDNSNRTRDTPGDTVTAASVIGRKGIDWRDVITSAAITANLHVHPGTLLAVDSCCYDDVIN